VVEVNLFGLHILRLPKLLSFGKFFTGGFLQINIFKIKVCILFSNKDDLLSFIKSDGSPLVKLIKLAVITFSILMIWRMRNYARFQDKIEVSMTILVIKDLTCLVGNSSKASMKNDMFDFNVLKFFGINTHTSKVLRPLLVRWEFPSPS